MNKLFLLCSMALFLGSCSNYLAEEESDSQTESDSKNSIPMTLQVRSSSQGTIDYPVDVYIFNKDGKGIKHNQIYSSQSPLDIKLPMGEYELSAFTGLDNKLYQIEEKTNSSSRIETKPGEPCPTPLQYGHVTFNLQEQMNIPIHLSYIVSSLEFILKEIPADVQSVVVGVTPTSCAFSLDGNYSNDTYMCKVNCQHVGNEWTAGPIYILPSTKSKTKLTLFLDRPSGKESLTYTYSSNLEANQPYRFCGKYNEGINLKGSFDVNGWQPGIDIDFDFTESGEITPEEDPQEDNHEKKPEGDENTDTYNSIIYTDDLPQSGDFYKDFYVWKAKITSSTEVKAVVLSNKQWFNILAVNAPDLLEEYTGLGLSDWRVFTKEEAKQFNEQFAETLPALNNKLREHNQDEFYFYKKERYLCDDCKSSFNVNGSNRVSAVGQKQTYYMRALKDVTFKIK